MIKTQKKLAVIALGNRNAGKSSTWYELFGRVIRSGWKTLQINNEEVRSFVKNSSFEETGQEITENVFVRNASFDEYGDDVEDYFGTDDLYNFVFCSVQYTEKGLRNIQYFKDNGYTLYIQWLNPGYHDRNDAKHIDVLGFENAKMRFAITENFTLCRARKKHRESGRLKSLSQNGS